MIFVRYVFIFFISVHVVSGSDRVFVLPFSNRLVAPLRVSAAVRCELRNRHWLVFVSEYGSNGSFRISFNLKRRTLCPVRRDRVSVRIIVKYTVIITALPCAVCLVRHVTWSFREGGGGGDGLQERRIITSTGTGEGGVTHRVCSVVSQHTGPTLWQRVVTVVCIVSANGMAVSFYSSSPAKSVLMETLIARCVQPDITASRRRHRDRVSAACPRTTATKRLCSGFRRRKTQRNNRDETLLTVVIIWRRENRLWIRCSSTRRGNATLLKRRVENKRKKKKRKKIVLFACLTLLTAQTTADYAVLRFDGILP